MVRWRQAASHYLSQCWPSSMSPYGVTLVIIQNLAKLKYCFVGKKHLKMSPVFSVILCQVPICLNVSLGVKFYSTPTWGRNRSGSWATMIPFHWEIWNHLKLTLIRLGSDISVFDRCVINVDPNIFVISDADWWHTTRISYSCRFCLQSQDVQ